MTSQPQITPAPEGRSDSELDPEIRRQLGAFYTPRAIVDLMVGQISEQNLAGSILEPSGGDGAFVEGLLATAVSAGSIEVWDINQDVQPVLTGLGVRVQIGDSLLGGLTGAYNAIIGNPPYLNKQSEYIKSNRVDLKKRYRAIGANDTYAMFTYRAAEMLAPDGQVVFLLSDTFLTLGIHEKFRRWLLSTMTVDSITLLPSDTFKAAVNTAVLSFTNKRPTAQHSIRFVDARSGAEINAIEPILRSQKGMLNGPGAVLSHTDDNLRSLRLVSENPSLLGYLHGGLGMHTGDNVKFLAVVEEQALTAKKGQLVIPAAGVDGSTWRHYHKRGGDRRWSSPAEHAVRWDSSSRKEYGVPKSALEGVDANGNTRHGFVLSGISSRLAAREMTAGALWESNKVFGFFPKQPLLYPVSFFVALLNSSTYSEIARALNHTVSLQVRDVKRLPMLPFSDTEREELTALGLAATVWCKAGGVGEAPQQQRIDELVKEVADRVLNAAMNAPK